MVKNAPCSRVCAKDIECNQENFCKCKHWRRYIAELRREKENEGRDGSKTRSRINGSKSS